MKPTSRIAWLPRPSDATGGVRLGVVQQFRNRFAVLLTFALATAAPSNSIPYAEAARQNPTNTLEQAGKPLSRELRELSDLLGTLQKKLQSQFNIKRVLLGGGSSRAVLDHIYFGKPLEMRDIDVFVVADREVTPEFAATIGKRLQSSYLGKFSEKDLRPRPRSNPSLPLPQRHEYNAGYGFFWLNDQNRIVDLSIYHHAEDLKLNGLFDIDRIMIPITTPRSLADTAQAAMKIPAEQLSTSGLILDSDSGYRNWVRKDPKLLNWADIERDPVLSSIRVTRSYAKAGKTSLPDEIRVPLSKLVNESKASNRLQIVRNLIKMIEDKEAAAELKILASLGAIEKWSPPLHRELSKLSLSEVQDLFERAPAAVEARGPPEATGKLRALIQKVPAADRIAIWADVATVEPRVAASGNRQALVEMLSSIRQLNSHALPEILEKVTEIEKIASETSRVLRSPVLKARDRDQLLLRALLRQIPKQSREAALTKLLPGSSRAFKAEVLRASEKLRKGFFSGVFNPIHHGHVEAALRARDEMVLDELILMPTPATAHNERPIAWELRIKMAELATAEQSGIRVIDPTYKTALEAGTGEAIARLTASEPDTVWIQVMGADSFERFASRGHFEKIASERGIYVVDRAGTEIPPGLREKVYFSAGAGSLSFEFTEQERSSSIIRALRKQGKGFEHLVPKPVANFIIANDLYRSPQMPKIGPKCPIWKLLPLRPALAH